MKIFVSHSQSFEFKEELYKPLREIDGCNFFFPHENESKNTQEEIKNSDLVLAEVSYPSTGQGIELGWANVSKIPILCIFKEGSKISGSLKYITDDFITYSSTGDLVDKLKSRFQK